MGRRVLTVAAGRRGLVDGGPQAGRTRRSALRSGRTGGVGPRG